VARTGVTCCRLPSSCSGRSAHLHSRHGHQASGHARWVGQPNRRAPRHSWIVRRRVVAVGPSPAPDSRSVEGSRRARRHVAPFDWRPGSRSPRRRGPTSRNPSNVCGFHVVDEQTDWPAVVPTSTSTSPSPRRRAAPRLTSDNPRPRRLTRHLLEPVLPRLRNSSFGWCSETGRAPVGSFDGCTVPFTMAGRASCRCRIEPRSRTRWR
jgi:hypothetical protein